MIISRFGEGWLSELWGKKWLKTHVSFFSSLLFKIDLQKLKFHLVSQKAYNHWTNFIGRWKLFEGCDGRRSIILKTRFTWTRLTLSSFSWSWCCLTTRYSWSISWLRFFSPKYWTKLMDFFLYFLLSLVDYKPNILLKRKKLSF